MRPQSFSIFLPDWVNTMEIPTEIVGDDAKMDFVIELSRMNVMCQTGGPFSAAVFAKDTLISIGVNRVVPNHCSLAHAEMTALALAQQHYRHFDLGGEDMPAHSLFVNAQPCVMCFGGVIWSGVSRLVYAASAKDVEELTGFDEGSLVTDWKDQLEKRGVNVAEGFMRDKACSILKIYRDSGALIYNARKG